MGAPAARRRAARFTLSPRRPHMRDLVARWRIAILIVVALALAWTITPSAGRQIAAGSRPGLGRPLRRHGDRTVARPGRDRSREERLGIQHRHRPLRHGEDVRRDEGPALPRLHQALGRRVRERAGRPRLGPVAHPQPRLHPARHARAVPATSAPATRGTRRRRRPCARPSTASRRTPTAASGTRASTRTKCGSTASTWASRSS